MQGTGIPIATPLTEEGAVDHDRLADLVGWVEDAGVDFLVPCGSTGEAPLFSGEERRAIVETVAEAADGPVLAGTGREGFEPTLAATEDAADAGADAALVVTPSYYDPDAAALSAYYRDLAEESPLPIYLYSVPMFTGVTLSPRTIASLADHGNVVGVKDSSGDVGALQRTIRRTPNDFDVLVGSGGVYAPALDAGADGGILALANAVPALASEIFRLHRERERAAARGLNADLAELNRTMVGRYGVAGVKAALALRGRPAGPPRRPLRPLADDERREIRELLDGAGVL
ncbi:dihydrodipicolinate synthase family protein [Halovivax sp.]|uniref:dihydrodipicolinate synthase family protein n=1 Tax=Halovivax sp. TaxID=1935978 RepID=UPI0025BAC128|nr:dihydrodipicolinate synthase family protein [Halovivax sp.]